MTEHKAGIVYVYDKNNNLIARFGEEAQGFSGTQTFEGISPDAMRKMMCAPTVRIASNGESTFSFQMLVNSNKWTQIKDPENIYYVDGRYYTALSENAYQYSGTGSVRVVDVSLVETWYLLSRKYNQAYNCGLYVYAKAEFTGYVTNSSGATYCKFDFQPANSYAWHDVSNPGNTISEKAAIEQIKQWQSKDSNGNYISYAILTDEAHKPTNWENAPSAVFFEYVSMTGYNSQVFVKSRTKAIHQQAFEFKSVRWSSAFNDYYVSGDYVLSEVLPDASEPLKRAIATKVTVNYTIATEETKDGKTVTTYKTDNQDMTFVFDGTRVNFLYPYEWREKNVNVTVNGVIITYEYDNLGDLKIGATCYFAYGAEVVDEHTFRILPKADTRYKLTVNNTTYEDSQVKDSRGVVMPRGSGGYAMWAALQGSGWQLGICDVIAKDFDTSIDYGCFNVESDMKDVLTNVQNIQKLYGGILDWDSATKTLNYRAENNTDYQAYDDSFNKWKGYQFREGKNMTEQPVITCDNDLITRAYILGYGNLNIKAVNNGKSYIDDFSYTNAIHEGYLSQELIYDTNDESGQRQLMYWGKKELAKYCRPRKTVSLTVTDIRTVEGHEHEIFNINDVVQVFYRDTEDNREIVEELRIVLWEYNVFARWDCTIELGEKTQNQIELFKLIYKKTSNLPNPNGSGQISGGNINVSGGNNLINNNTLTGRLELISRTTTDNSDAIAGLIIDTSNTYAMTQLFAQYQKKTADVLTNTYAGLQVYADEKMAYAIQEANYHSESLGNDLLKEIVDTKAACMTYADEQGAAAQLYAEGKFETLSDEIDEIVEAQAGFKAEVTKEYARIDALATYKITDRAGNTYYLSQAGLKSIASEAVAENSLIASLTSAGIYNTATLTQHVEEDFAENSLFAQFYNWNTKEYSLALFRQYVGNQISSSEIINEIQDELGNTVSRAEIHSLVTDELAAAGFSASFGDIVAYVEAIASPDGPSVHMYGNVHIDSGKTFYYYGDRVGWTYVQDNSSGKRWQVLGLYGQDGIYFS